MLNKSKIAIIGPGVMGEAILAALLKNGNCQPENITIAGPDAKRNQQLHQEYMIQYFEDNARAASDADIIVLAVKPQRFGQAVKPLKGTIKPDALLVSIIAGVTLESLAIFTGHEKVVRAMPNTPARIARGITAWTATKEVDEKQMTQARELFKALGDEVFVDYENYLDMATAVSGTGPAYVFLFAEAMIDAGVHLGLPRRIAEQLVTETIRGSIEFYTSNYEHPAKLRNDVTSPGGTSAEALYYLEKAGFRTAISRAVFAAFERSQELGMGMQAKLESEK